MQTNKSNKKKQGKISNTVLEEMNIKTRKIKEINQRKHNRSSMELL